MRVLTISLLTTCQSRRLRSERHANSDHEHGSDSALVDHVAPCSIQVRLTVPGADLTRHFFFSYVIGFYSFFVKFPFFLRDRAT